MAGTRKLGKPTDQRLAMLKTQTTDLLVNGKIVTTEARAKEIKAIVDSVIALAVKEHKNFEEVEVKVVKAKLDDKGKKVTEKVTNEVTEKVTNEVTEKVKKESQLEIARKMIKMKMGIDDISKVTGLSKEDVKKLNS